MYSSALKVRNFIYFLSLYYKPTIPKRLDAFLAKFLLSHGLKTRIRKKHLQGDWKSATKSILIDFGREEIEFKTCCP
jgi:hypothetical protein